MTNPGSLVVEGVLPPDFASAGQTETESRTEVRKPPLYKVLLHNDDFTTMEFVVFVLESIFHLPEDVSMRIMLQVHTRGIGVAGTYTYEIAEMKVARTTALARAHEFPLLCTLEEA